MTLPATFSFSSPGDAARAAELRRVKALATLVLAGTLALFVTAKILLPLHPAFGFVAAFAEALDRSEGCQAYRLQREWLDQRDQLPAAALRAELDAGDNNIDRARPRGTGSDDRPDDHKH